MFFNSACFGPNFCCRTSNSFLPSLVATMASWMLTIPILVGAGPAGALAAPLDGAGAPDGAAAACATAARENMVLSPRLRARIRVVNVPDIALGYSLNLRTELSDRTAASTWGRIGMTEPRKYA